jgi:hypothetical protein
MSSLKPSAWVLFCALTASLAFAGNPSDDYSGLYSFLHDGESIQLNIQDGRLTGWVSSHGVLESDHDTLLDRFFKEATLEGNQIYFVTKPIHGCWFEFSGRLDRGQARDRSREDYFRMAGTLTEYVTDPDGKVTARKRDAVFKSNADSSLASNGK